MKVSEFANYIEGLAPLCTAMSYDNPGLIIGNPDDEIKKVLIALDVTAAVVDEAVEKGCDFILSHHPLIWAGIKKLTPSYPTADAVVKAIRAGIGVYAAHTNADQMADSMSVELLKNLKAEGIEPLFEGGLGAIGDVEETTFGELVKTVEGLLNEKARSIGNLSDKVKRVATVSGAGGDNDDVAQAMRAGADVYITAELKHNVAVLAKEAGFKIIEVSHFASEICFVEIFNRLLKGVVEAVPAESQTNPYNKEI